MIADGLVGAAALLPMTRERDVIYLAHNFESGFRSFPGLEGFERRILESFAETWMVTGADIDGARRLAPNAGLMRVVPNVVDVAAIAAPGPGPAEPVVLLVADFFYAPNREGFDLLAEQVMPRVWEHRPDASLRVAGRALEVEAPDPRIAILGFVDNLDAEYERAGVVTVPLLRGGGSPLKFVEALAHGRPVVATEHAARLLEEGVAGRHFIAAGDADAMAAAIVDVLGGGGAQLDGRALVREHYSVDALAERLAT